MKKIIELDSSTNLDELFNQLISAGTDIKEELLLRFNLKTLNKRTGKKVILFLNNLNKKGTKFKISRPLPRCIFGSEYDKITNKLNIPKTCFECEELFLVENDVIKSCDLINKKGPKIYYLPKRQQIFEYFNTLKTEKKLTEKCKKCLYFRRNRCSCLTFSKQKTLDKKSGPDNRNN